MSVSLLTRSANVAQAPRLLNRSRLNIPARKVTQIGLKLCDANNYLASNTVEWHLLDKSARILFLELVLL